VPNVRAPFRLTAAVALCGAAAATACRELAFEPQDPATVTFAPALGITLSAFTRLPSGVYYQDVAVGSGAVVTDSSTVTVSYRGFLASGQAFDSTLTGQTRQFDLRGTVPGFRTGLAGARSGGRRRLVIPPELGYGNTTRQSIPAGSVLYFVIDVAGVTTPTSPPPTTSRRRP
jgi:hypothetical protein